MTTTNTDCAMDRLADLLTAAADQYAFTVTGIPSHTTIQVDLIPTKWVGVASKLNNQPVQVLISKTTHTYLVLGRRCTTAHATLALVDRWVALVDEG